MENLVIEGLNPEQKDAVLDTEGAVLVLAGAGSGKTKVLTSRVAHLMMNNGVSPKNILAITFTNKAANEMKERISKFADCNGMWVCTIHSMCTRIMRANAEKLGYTSSFTIYTETEKAKVVKDIIKSINVDEEKIDKLACWHISNAKNLALNPMDYKIRYKDYDNIDIFTKIYQKYEEELNKNNAFDFDDLILKTYNLFTTCPQVLEKYQDRFQYIHIDEFQDTNRTQFLIVKALAGKHKNIFAVGDDDQSIYGWRGADISNILDFEKSFKGAKIHKLEQNYRCSKTIIDAANKIISTNTQRMDKKLWTDNSQGVRIESFSGYDEKQEAFFVANTIKSLVKYNGYKFSDFAILMRVNALSNTFEQEFLKYNIPHKMFGGQKFFDRKEVRDAIAYLSILVNPQDSLSINRILNVPKRGIGASAIASVQNVSDQHNINFLDAILMVETLGEHSSATKSKIIKFRDIVLKMQEALQTMTLSKFVKFALECSGLYEMFDLKTEDGRIRQMNLDQFVYVANTFERDNPNSNLVDFLQSITLSTDIDNSDNSFDYTTLATVHSVKGLEFKVVFVVGLDDKIFPLSRAKSNLKELEEERRLMYVAITRAKERLYVTRANSRYMFGKRDYMMCSMFWQELAEFVEQKKQQMTTNQSVITGRNNAGQKIAMPDKDMSKCVIGTKINHLRFGEGKIDDISGDGDSMVIGVIFPGLGKKTLSVKLAPIEFLGEEA